MIRLAVAALAAITCTAGAAQAQGTGLLVVAHGADSGWNARVHATVNAVAWDGPRAVAFLMGADAVTQGWDSALAQLASAGATTAVVVPLMVSSHGSHYRQVQHYAGMDVPLPAELSGHDHGTMTHPPFPVIITSAIDAAPELGAVLRDRLREFRAPASAPVLLVAHGPNSDGDALRWTRAILQATSGIADGRDLRVALLRDDAPDAVRSAAVAAMRDTLLALAARSGDSVTVVSVLVSQGSINRVRIPADLQGMPMRYAGVSLAPHPALARWIGRVAREALPCLAGPGSAVDRQGVIHQHGGHAQHGGGEEQLHGHRSPECSG